MSEERERDIVVAPNEFVFVMDRTKGVVNTICGSQKISMSNSDSLVKFNRESKRFEEVSGVEAIQTFVTAPETYYIVLKNPAEHGNEHPRPGSINNLPNLLIGKKINIVGPASFALYPGQMADVIQGHKLKSNQYILARVYDDSELTDEYDDLSVGQQIIIKGTDVSFYIPPTGIEVIKNSNGDYVRDAVTLERLEYCIKKNEHGDKTYVNGPAVVFPEPDEEFIINQENGTYKFRAIELSDISGVYVKVVADYSEGKDEKKKSYKAGEELFITGKDQMIYYPRAEHAIIDYEGKIIHHAIAIPNGEGRYVLNRKTGDVKMVKGPAMYLPDPRYEVIVRRKLTKKQCELWYPGNDEVLNYNVPYSAPITINANDIISNSITYTSYSPTVTLASNYHQSDSLSNGFVGQDNAVVDNSGFNRGNTYTKPRMITIDNKFDGVVTIDIWTGYAINVVGKNGNRKVVVGPQTYLLAYDETLEVVNTSEGQTVYLKVDNNKIDDLVTVQTKDFVNINVGVSYCVSFDPAKKDDWFSIENYVNFLKDFERSNIKRKVKEYTLEEFYNNAADIIRGCVLVTKTDKNAKNVIFSNGMYVSDVEIGDVVIKNQSVGEMLDKHQKQIVEKSLALSTANKEIAVSKELSKIRQEKLDLDYKNAMHEIEIKNKTEAEKIKSDDEIAKMKTASEKAAKEAEKDLQIILDAIKKAELNRIKMENDASVATQKEVDKLEADRQKSYTDALKKVIDSISPDLIAAVTTSSHEKMLKEVAQSLSPYALASGEESVSDVVDKLLRGTSMEGLLKVAIPDKTDKKA